jgi:site-specific DNA recombinase
VWAGNDQDSPHSVAAYIRWSTEEQGHGTTLQIQRERVELFIRSQGWDWREDLVFVDDGHSGGSLDRPAMGRLREAVLAGRVDCVVVYKLDRLSRSLLDTVSLVRQEWQGRCMLHSATENFDTRSPVGQMVFNILASFAEFERNLIRERTLSGKRKRAQQGRNAGQRYPYGLRKGPDGGWALDGRDPATGQLVGPAAVVRRIFTAFLCGQSMGTIAEALNRDGVRAPAGGAWAFATVGRVLANPLYAGEYRYGKQPLGSCVVGAAPSVITPDEYEQACRQRAQRYTRRERASPGAYLLTGLARCLRCGSPLAGSLGKARRYYVCTGRTLQRQCDCAYMDAASLEEAVMAAVRQVVEPYLSQICPGNGRPANSPELAESCRSARARAEADLAATARRRRRLEDQFLAGQIDGAAYRRMAERLDHEEGEARERLGRAAAAVDRLAGGVAFGLPAEVVDPWAGLSFGERRQALRELIAALRIYQPKHRPGSKRGNPHPIDLQWQPRAE